MQVENLETPYEEEDEYIECKICEKSLRGNSLYKIHLITSAHIKRESVLAAEGKVTRQHVVPKFKDILEYLEYLNLDEPIIGLNFFEEMPSFEPLLGPKYNCRLCNLSGAVVEMIFHVIGRKHRQRYVEVERPDLVTWDNQTAKTQVGKSIRAKAEIVERQDGQGTPKMLLRRRSEDRVNVSRAPPNQWPKRDENLPQQTHQEVPPLLPEFKDYKDKKNVSGYQETPGFFPNEPPNKRWFGAADPTGHDRFQEKRGRPDYREGFDYRKEFKKPDVYDPFESEYARQQQGSGIPGPQDAQRYDYGHQMSRGQFQDVNYYPAGAPPNKRPCPERDPLDEQLYSEEVKRGQASSFGHQRSSQMMYPEGDKRSFMESSTHNNMTGARRQGSSEPEAKRRSFSSPLDTDPSHEQMLIKDYCYEPRDQYQEKAFDNAGPNKAGPSSSQRRVEVSSIVSDIPEPFRRFMKGNENDETRSAGKRRSRFSDASPEEVKVAKETDEYKPSYMQTDSGRDSRPGGGLQRPETHFTQYSDHPTGLQASHFGESYSRGGSESGGVFDMLKNVQIESAEEADFLKSKLASVLAEFKNKKMEKAGYDSQSRAGASNYGDSVPPLRDSFDHRRQDDPNFSHGRGWEQRDYTSEQHQQEYNHPVQMEPRYSSRGRFEDQPSYYPERFQESMHPQDYQPADGQFFEPHSSAAPLQMEQKSRDSRYSNNLDKITSTLLELVARK
ncbi:uncharacterized protein si:ch211-13c6.2 isoform X2 [Nematolebias whitei]|uniref:uncharacterized protein si:ch211-13c6.2 isoform X2 n=1 Tax=Nematolebias whitei TaxID=451745 RepID=UPI001896E884|nr:uncharacterized protein si:ch211-13c6.2 isoform X2 [Nematolebias whitei]